jgi:hypothetical protein
MVGQHAQLRAPDDGMLQVEVPAFVPALEKGLEQEAWLAYQEAAAVQQGQQRCAEEAEAAAREAAMAGRVRHA